MLLCALHITRLGAPSSPLPFRFSRQDTASVRWWLLHCMLNGVDSAGTMYEFGGDANAVEWDPSAGPSAGPSAAYVVINLVSSSEEEDEEEEEEEEEEDDMDGGSNDGAHSESGSDNSASESELLMLSGRQGVS